MHKEFQSCWVPGISVFLLSHQKNAGSDDQALTQKIPGTPRNYIFCAKLYIYIHILIYYNFSQAQHVGPWWSNMLCQRCMHLWKYIYYYVKPYGHIPDLRRIWQLHCQKLCRSKFWDTGSIKRDCWSSSWPTSLCCDLRLKGQNPRYTAKPQTKETHNHSKFCFCAQKLCFVLKKCQNPNSSWFFTWHGVKSFYLSKKSKSLCSFSTFGGVLMGEGTISVRCSLLISVFFLGFLGCSLVFL